MQQQGLFFFMYLTYLIVGVVFLAAVSAALLWLVLAQCRRGATSSTLRGQEFVWTLVPALVFVGLSVLGEISLGWVNFPAAPRAAEVQSRLTQ